MLSESFRQYRGLPSEWGVVEKWLFDRQALPVFPAPVHSAAPLKWPDIPVLGTYDGSATDDFWSHFPVRDLPTEPSSVLDCDRLQQLVQQHKSSFTRSQWLRSQTARRESRHSACAFQKSDLPEATIPNSGSTFQHAVQFTDNVCSLLRAGFLAGPFATAPLAKFCANSMLAIARKNKLRVVMNLSAPAGASF